MCGSETELVRAKIEEVELKVCKKCARHGIILRPPKEKKIVVKEIVPEQIEMIKKDFSEIIRKKRKRMGLKQEEFASRIKEKESVVHKMETGEYKPSLKLAKKMESMLGIELTEFYEEKHATTKKEEMQTMTIGDMIKLKINSKKRDNNE